MALQLLSGQLLQTPHLPATDLTGQTIIVTGANSGLGLDAAKHLNRLNCSHLILACRDLIKGEKAKNEILSHNGKEPKDGNTKRTISVWELDMCSYSSVSAFASKAATLPALHGAILNAGVDLVEFSLSESIETTLTVNVTSTFLLAILLIPVLRSSSSQDTKASPSPIPRLTIVGSAVHHFAKHDQLVKAATTSRSSSSSSSLPLSSSDVFRALSDPQTVKMADRYFLSKLLVMLLTVHLAGVVTESSKTPKVVLNCVSPGYCQTPLFRHDSTPASRMALRIIGRSSEEGSRTLVHGVTEADRTTHGAYLSECRIKKTSDFVRSEEGKRMGQVLWNDIVNIAERAVPGCVERL